MSVVRARRRKSQSHLAGPVSTHSDGRLTRKVSADPVLFFSLARNQPSDLPFNPELWSLHVLPGPSVAVWGEPPGLSSQW